MTDPLPLESPDNLAALIIEHVQHATPCKMCGDVVASGARCIWKKRLHDHCRELGRECPPEHKPIVLCVACGEKHVEAARLRAVEFIKHEGGRTTVDDEVQS